MDTFLLEIFNLSSPYHKALQQNRPINMAVVDPAYHDCGQLKFFFGLTRI